MDGWLTFILHEKIHDRGLDCIPRYNWSWWGAPVDATIGRKRTWELYRKHFTPEFYMSPKSYLQIQEVHDLQPNVFVRLKFTSEILSTFAFFGFYSGWP